MNPQQESRSRGGGFHSDYFDEMDAFDPFTIEKELQRQAESVPSNKKMTFMKKFHYNSDGIPKRITFEADKKDSKFSSASTVASSSTESTTLSSHWSSNDSQLDEISDTAPAQGRSSVERRPRPPSAKHLGHPMSRSSSQGQAPPQHHHEAAAMRAPPGAPVEEVYACSPENNMNMLSECVHNRPSRYTRTSSTPETNSPGPPRTPKYTDLPRRSAGSEQRRHKDPRSTKIAQRASSLVLDRERRGPSDRRRHMDDLFEGPTPVGRGSKCENPPKSQVYQHNRSRQSPPRPPRRTNSVDRGTHLNSLFGPSGPEVKIPPMVQSHWRR
mmetsp:Transcript_8948/g.14911  ORF Transcript_8948/g.14911 Transcript_8948/m.14911 type:complete len:327 (+) Transcript_8948:57-1037(+)